ncbi:MAG: DUF3084 domain-containing protein [Synechococcales cyanobacterium RM1_1_8]|nr:DUF3084 domain-containing protein [Synechococcales cyanobacterium RM1_1_8]
MAGVILVLSVLILGGVIATIGDRLGTKVGKARLSLMGMRPRKTAVAITILTGGVISATTLGILFATNSQLRTGVFELESIQEKARKARLELEETQAERRRAEQERDQARQEQIAAQQRLETTRKVLAESLTKQQQTQAQLTTVGERAERLRSEAERLQQEQQILMQQRDQVARQIVQRNRDIADRDRDIAQQEAQLNRQKSQLSDQNSRLSRQGEAIARQGGEIRERDAQLSQRNAQIAERDAQIAAQRNIVAAGESKVRSLEETQARLDEEIRLREEGLLLLRAGNVALTRREVLAMQVVRVLSPDATQNVILPLLQAANRRALEAVRPGAGDDLQIIQITQSQVERLREQIQDGQDYVVQILSAGNYVRGEDRVIVFTNVVPNKVIFPKGELIASINVDLPGENSQTLQDRLDLVLEQTRFRARQAGIVSESMVVGDASLATAVRFYNQLNTYEGSFTLQAITSTPAYTIGPLRIDLVAIRDGQVVLSTGQEALA